MSAHRQAVAVALFPSELQLVRRALRELLERETSHTAEELLEMLADPPPADVFAEFEQEAEPAAV